MRRLDVLEEALTAVLGMHERGSDAAVSRSLVRAIGDGDPDNATASSILSLMGEAPELRDLIPRTLSWAESAVTQSLRTPKGAGGGATIHTDGACSGNPGPGGWAIIVDNDGETYSRYGSVRDTTNNRMEMTAMIEALSEAESIGGPALIRSDSEYVIKGLQEWMPGWISRGWRSASGKAVVNRDLWEQMRDAKVAAERAGASITIRHVKGHSGDPRNEECDRLAVRARDAARDEDQPSP